MSMAATSAIRAPQLRTTMSATGPLALSPNVDRSAASGASAAWTIVIVRTPEPIMIRRMFTTIQDTEASVRGDGLRRYRRAAGKHVLALPAARRNQWNARTD